MSSKHSRNSRTLVLGLPTGRTPLPLYRALVAHHAKGESDYSKVTTFNLDEFVGIAPSHPGSYRSYMREHLFRHVNVSPRRTHFLDGQATDLEAECGRFEDRILRVGRHRPADPRHRRERPHRLQRAGGGSCRRGRTA